MKDLTCSRKAALFMVFFFFALSLSAQAAVAERYISNSPSPSGPAAPLEEVWMRHGGARLYYDSLLGPTQMNTNGARYRDPASFKGLPPVVGPETKKRSSKSVNPKASSAQSTASKGRGGATSSTPALGTGNKNNEASNGAKSPGPPQSSPALQVPANMPAPGSISGARPGTPSPGGGRNEVGSASSAAGTTTSRTP